MPQQAPPSPLHPDAEAQLALQCVFQEAHHLDDRNWDAWLELYLPDASFWVPAWLDDDTVVSDPATAVSLVYHTSRQALADRVARLRSGKSVTTTPLARTTHLITTPLVQHQGNGQVLITSNFSVMVFEPRSRRQHTLFGQYRHELAVQQGQARIRQKRIILRNDEVPTLLDFYSL